PEYCGVEGRIDILTGTLGKALGGASGGYVAARSPVVELLRQRSRPYLFSNALAPSIVTASLAVLKLLRTEDGAERRRKVVANSRNFRKAMAAKMANALLAEGIYVIGFSFPVVPKGQARIRTQMSAAHTDAHIEQAVAAFAKVGRQLGAI